MKKEHNRENQTEFQRDFNPFPAVDKLYVLKKKISPGGIPVLIHGDEPAFTPIDIPSVLGKSGPIEIEIGCGKGGFMVEYCHKYPDSAFLGIEKEFSIARYAASRIAKRKALVYARVIWGNAYYFFRDFLPSNAVKAFHMYFPDPWPKKRHKKRRLLDAAFLNEVYRTALPDARFYWATDHAEYHELAMAAFKKKTGLYIIRQNSRPTENILTNFEKKYRLEGRKIYRTVLCIRKPAAI